MGYCRYLDRLCKLDGDEWDLFWDRLRDVRLGVFRDSPSMPVRGLGCSFEGVPGGDKWLFLKTQRDEIRSVRKSHGQE